MPWVKLKRAYTNKRGKKFFVGTLKNVDRKTYKEMMENGTAEDYTGEIPPKRKIKTEFFKPKMRWQ